MERVITRGTLIGRNKEGEKFFLRVSVKEDEREWQTITHEKIIGAPSLSMSGYGVSPRGSLEYERGVFSAGQNYEMLLEITEPAKGFTIKDVRRLYEIWRRWHLNDMKSHCAHQDKSVKWDEVAPCPLTGYKAGSAWLTEPLPSEIVEELAEMLAREKVSA